MLLTGETYQRAVDLLKEIKVTTETLNENISKVIVAF